MAASSETIKDIVIHRLNAWDMMAPLLIKHGLDRVMEAIEDTASFHAGCEEIGTSDVNHMIDGMMRGMGEPSIFDRG